MSRILQTPQPPYTVVIFTAQRTAEDEAGYVAASRNMAEMAAQQPGYLGLEVAYADGVELAISYWTDEAAARAWKRSSEHLLAQSRGRKVWYKDYRVRVATVTRDYGPSKKAKAKL